VSRASDVESSIMGSGDEGGASKLTSNWREKMIGALCESKKKCDDPLVADPISLKGRKRGWTLEMKQF
jgi:hypothetical protein